MRRVLVIMVVATLAVLVASASGMAGMKLSIWDYEESRLNLIKEYAAQYHAQHPEIEFEYSLSDFDSYFAKVPVAIAAGTPPDIFEFHNVQTDRFVENNMLAPFPESIFPLSEYDRKYMMFKPSFVINGHMYFHPGGTMTGAIYYNKDALAAAGFNQVPQRWNDFVTAAQKLTLRNADGRMQQVGFQFGSNIGNLFTDLVYQQGGYLFKADKTGVEYGSAAGRAAIGLVERLVNADVSDQRAGVTAMGNFQTGNVAMKYNWTYLNGELATVKGLNWGVALIPTPDGGSLPARARNNYECDLAVPATVPADRQTEAFKFIKWLGDNDNFNIRLNQMLGRVPARRDLWTKPDLRNDAVYQMLVSQAPYTVYPGPLPNWLAPTLSAMQDRIRNNQIAAGTALDMAVQEGNAKYKELAPRYIVERLYEAPK